jgi:hypothetical protein
MYIPKNDLMYDDQLKNKLPNFEEKLLFNGLLFNKQMKLNNSGGFSEQYEIIKKQMFEETNLLYYSAEFVFQGVGTQKDGTDSEPFEVTLKYGNTKFKRLSDKLKKLFNGIEYNFESYNKLFNEELVCKNPIFDTKTNEFYTEAEVTVYSHKENESLITIINF